MRAVITVAGKDRVGIIAEVTQALAHQNVNVLDISQTILDGYFTMLMIVDVTNASVSFTMVMLVDASQCKVPFGDLADQLAALGNQSGLAIQAQREDTFQAMHRI